MRSIIFLMASMVLLTLFLMYIGFGTLSVKIHRIRVMEINHQPVIEVFFVSLRCPLYVELIGPEANLLDFRIIREHSGRVLLFIGPPGYNIPSGVYFIVFRDEMRRIILARNIILQDPKLSIKRFQLIKEVGKEIRLRGINLTILNQGDAPAYFKHIKIRIEPARFVHNLQNIFQFYNA